MRPGKRDRAVEERGQRDANAGQRSGEQLGVHGHGGVGLESEGVVWAIGAGSGSRHGISAVPARDHSAAGADHPVRAQDCVSAAGLQRLAEGFLCDLATTAEARIAGIG